MTRPSPPAGAPTSSEPPPALAVRVLLAFAAIYLIWGSTYLAIRFAIETIPPFLMAGLRSVIAGSVLYAWARARGAAAPALAGWREATILGGLMLLGGNGAVTWSEQHVPSGLAAVVVATVPLWVVLLERRRPSARVVAGIAFGLLGIALLVGPEELAGAGRIDPFGTLVLVGGSLSWAIGSLRGRTATLSTSPWLSIAMQMFAGGALLVLFGLAAGEGPRFVPTEISARSLAALAYLVVFGSLVAFSSYLWLMKVSQPARVATYAYVNPIVALVLGWALAGEPLTARTIVASAIVIAAVVFIVGAPRE